MKKLKLFVLGLGIAGATTFGVSFLPSSDTEAQGNIAKCNWNGDNCFDPIDDAMCVCEKESGGDR